MKCMLFPSHPVTNRRLTPSIAMPGTTKSAVEITYELLDPMRQDLFDYLISNIDALDEGTSSEEGASSKV